MPRLTIYVSDTLYKEIALSELDLILIGRSPSSDICLPDSSNKVSRHHAALIRLPEAGGRYFIRDLGSLHSIMVCNEIVDYKLLENGDVITIGDYSLHFEVRTQAASDPGHLRIVSKQAASDMEDNITSPLRRPRDLMQTALNPERLEIMNQLHAMVSRTADPAELLNWLIVPVLRVLNADRGFARMFRDSTGEVFSDIGVTPAGTGCDIEISEECFLDYIKQGESVLDGTTLLAPILCKQQALGFFCIARRPSDNVFSLEDSVFLMRLGEQATSTMSKAPQQKSQDKSPEFPIEWPVRIVGRSRRMRELQEQIQQAACSDSNTLVIGETGTGKELVANAIHEHSRFFRGPFIAKHCGQITSGLAEAALFGYAPKSGISEAKLEGSPGWFEQANHGILFLDEIQTATGSIQDMFLRVLEDKTVCRFGARQSTPLDLKVVAATSEMDLNKAVEDGAFRAALYYRFRSKVYLPPLRERKEDIPLLAYYFLDKYARKAQAKTRTISHAALAILLHYDWPGNVRELEGIIEHAIGRDKEVLFSWDFNPSIRRRSPESKLVALDEPLRLGETGTKVHIQGQEFKTMERVEHEKILEALEVTHGNVTKAAEILGYKSRQTLLTKMDKFKIPRSYADPKG